MMAIAALLLAVLALVANLLLWLAQGRTRSKAERSLSELAKLQGQVVELRRKFAQLQTPPPNHAPAIAPPTQPAPAVKAEAAEVAPPVVMADQAPPTDTTPLPAIDNSPSVPVLNQWYQQILDGWNHLAADASLDERSAFVERFSAKPADREAMLSDTADYLWWIRTSDDGGGIVLPGWKPLRDWKKSYGGVMGQLARTDLEIWYGIVEGDMLRVQSPATGRLGDDGRIVLVTKGAMTGA